MKIPVFMDTNTSHADRILKDGYALVENVISKEQVDALRDSILALCDDEAVRRKTNVYGVRNLLELNDEVKRLAASPEIRSLVSPVLGSGCFAVRATFFDKLPDANWNVSWHQDGVISVKERVETPGFHAWANKAGTIQVRPPEKVLSRMLAIRVHLDDCPAANGALRVLSGSHIRLWPEENISNCKSEFREVVCEIGAGGVLAMRPLVLHASSAADSPDRRRVIHLEFACDELPGGLEWKQRIARNFDWPQVN